LTSVAKLELTVVVLFFLSLFRCNNKSIFEIAINVNGINEYKKGCTLRLNIFVNGINEYKKGCTLRLNIFK